LSAWKNPPLPIDDDCLKSAEILQKFGKLVGFSHPAGRQVLIFGRGGEDELTTTGTP
jgi:hypothetical protein